MQSKPGRSALWESSVTILILAAERPNVHSCNGRQLLSSEDRDRGLERLCLISWTVSLSSQRKLTAK